MAGGTYCVFLNAGDVFFNKDTLSLVDEVLENSDGEVLFGGANLTFSNRNNRYRRPKKIERYIWHGLPANHQSTYYPLSWIKRNPYDLRYKFCGDYYLAAKLYLDRIRPVYLDNELVNFRVGDYSYKHPLSLVYEAYLIQKNTLGIRFHVRILSMVRRVIAILATTVLYNINK